MRPGSRARCPSAPIHRSCFCFNNAGNGRPADRPPAARRRLAPHIEFDVVVAPAGARLCRLDELPDGDARGFDPFHAGHDTVLVVRRGNTVYGWQDSCPHIDGARMAWRKNAYLNAARDRIVCSAHGALFEIVSGICTLGPCLGQSFAAGATGLDADGTVYLQ